jgi:hypothetical protein
MGLATDKFSRQGPTPEMLQRFYPLMLMLTGDLSENILGPFNSRSADDVNLLQYWLRSSTEFEENGLWVMGNGFAESAYSWSSDLLYFMREDLGADLRLERYADYGSMEACVDLRPTSQSAPNGTWYGVRSLPSPGNDVLSAMPEIGEATAASYYEDLGWNGPYIAGVYKASSSIRPWICLLDGFRLRDVGIPDCADTRGRNGYVYEIFQNIFSPVCTVVGNHKYLDVPGEPAALLQPYLEIRSNPVRFGAATFDFGLPKAGSVTLAVYDVSGRRIETLINGPLAAGRHTVTWRNRRHAGRTATGVYFVRYLTDGFNSSRKVVLLR